MKEKDRYEYYLGTNSIKDNKTNQIYDYVVDLLNQQDKRIKELQQQLAENNEFFNAFACKDFNEFKDFISTFMLTPHEEQTLIRELKQQLAITEKALELACERVKYFEEMQDKEMGFYEFFGYDSDYDLKAIIEQYKEQAKEMLENE